MNKLITWRYRTQILGVEHRVALAFISSLIRALRVHLFYNNFTAMINESSVHRYRSVNRNEDDIVLNSNRPLNGLLRAKIFNNIHIVEIGLCRS